MRRRRPSNICLTCGFVPEGLGAFCASGAQRQHKMCQRKYQVEAGVSIFSAGWPIFNLFSLYSAGEPIFNILFSLTFLNSAGWPIFSIFSDIRLESRSSIYFRIYILLVRPNGRSLTPCCMIHPKDC